jgi:hypothetical protein
MGYDLTVKVTQAKYKEVMVAIKVQNPKEIQKAKEIERAIDSHLKMLILKT